MLRQKEIEELDLASSVCLAWEFITQEEWALQSVFFSGCVKIIKEDVSSILIIGC